MTKRPSILLVDDNDALRMAVARFLQGKGCRVTTASNGVQGLKAIRREQFDVVVTDIDMPERGGIWLWERAVQEQPALRGRFVFASGDTSPNTTGMGLYIGSERFFLKPLSLVTLWSQIEDIVRGDARTPDASRQPRSPSL